MSAASATTMKLFSTNTCPVPRNLGSVTRYAPAEEAMPGATGLPLEVQGRVWKAVEDLYRSGGSPAVTFCLRHKGQILLNRAIGHARGNGPHDAPDAPKVLATPDTPVCLFSASKVITAMLIHLLDERGDIDLLDPISRYIPEYGVNGKRNATIYHLLSHRGGIPKIDGDVDPELLFDYDAVLARLCAARPVNPSGHRAAYHAITAGYILGEIIRRVTGKDARQFLKETIQEPMGMTYFNYGIEPALRDNAAINYCTGLKPLPPVSNFIEHAIGGSLELAVQMTNDPRYMDAIVPAGNLYATAEEASRFFQMLLNKGSWDGKQIFKPETVHRAVLETNKPELDGTLLIPMRYSMGMMLGSSPVGMFGPRTSQAYGHLGFSNIFCWADPSREISVALLTTGKALVGPHLLPLGRLLNTISREFPRGSGHK